MNINVKYSINKSIDVVFDAIVNPGKMICYFTSGVRGEMEMGKTIIWEFDDYGVELQVKILQLVKNKSISFEWDASGKLVRVDMVMESVSTNKTTLEITESSYELSEKEVPKALQQMQGWTDFICSLKAYLYTGVNLRNGKMA